MYITNAQKRAFTVPATADDKHAAVTINPGETKPIDAEHWNTVRKGNDVLDALVSGRYLIPSNDEPRDRPHLSNPPTGEIPPELQEPEDKDAKVKRTTKSVDTLDLGGDDEEDPKSKTPRRAGK